MKIAIATSGKNLDSPFARHFGCAEQFIIIDTETEEWKTYPNPALGASSDAGVQAAKFIADQGVLAVISGNFGPHAAKTLAVAGIQIYLATCTARDLLASYQAGQLKQSLPSFRNEPRPLEISHSPIWPGF